MSLSGILLRFDDIHPEMNWDIWDDVKAYCIEKNIKPLIAVIPENRDQTICFGSYRENFWEELSQLQEIGWGIGLHGYQHLYTEESSGMIGLHQRSEFSGLPFEQQLAKIKNGLEIFKKNKVVPDLFIAPSHSFDHVTISALLEAGINVISDGYAIYPHTDDHGMTWLPCQRWRLGFNKIGLWTVCLHPNNWTHKELCKFQEDVQKYEDRITSFSSVCEYGKSRRSNFFEQVIERALNFAIRSKFILKTFKS